MNFLEISQSEDSPKTSDKFDIDWLFVIPLQQDSDACMVFIKENYLEIFQIILATWDTDKRLWPKDLSYEQFDKYFSFSFHSALYDLSATDKYDGSENGICSQFCNYAGSKDGI